MRTSKVNPVMTTPANNVVICPVKCIKKTACPFRASGSKHAYIRTDQDLMRSLAEPVKSLVLEAGSQVKSNSGNVVSMYMGAGSPRRECFVCMFYSELEELELEELEDEKEPKPKRGRKKNA